MRKIKILFFFLTMLASFQLKAQVWNYTYKCPLTGVQNQWHRIILPDDLYEKISPAFSDIRILGIKQNGDSIEAPYILQNSQTKQAEINISFKLINRVSAGDGYFYTFELPADTVINSIQLHFNDQSFDWKINLEAGHDQQQWYSLLKDYRITAIKNQEVDFRFSKLIFPPAYYRFFRLYIPSRQQPSLSGAAVSRHETSGEILKTYPVSTILSSELKKEKQNVFSFALVQAVPVSRLQLFVKDSFDYYRPCRIETVTDSFKNGNETTYQYTTVYNGILNSWEKTPFVFEDRIAKKFRIVIDNHDNRPLQAESVWVQGYEYHLTARFTEPAAYFLVYGNTTSASPSYDLTAFSQKIPATLQTLEPGPAVEIKKEAPEVTKPLFQNKLWLWAVMLIIISLLGWFTLKMMKRENV